MCSRRCVSFALVSVAVIIGLVNRAGVPPKPHENKDAPLTRVQFDTTGAHRTTRCIYQHRIPDGFPEVQDFGIATLPVPALRPGDVMVESKFVSVDPYMRAGMGGGGQELEPLNGSAPDALGQLLARLVGGENVGKVVESAGPAEIPVGTLVRGSWRWCEVAVLPASLVFPLDSYHEPASSALGVLGMPGRTAYYGLFEVLKPEPGQVLFVSGAHGATGAVVGQLGKIAGLRVLGSAGSKQKVQELYDMGFDGAFNYREEDAQMALKRLAPDGIDLYFDNTGGPVSEAVAFSLRPGGRVAICGQIYWYQQSGPGRLLLRFLHAMLPNFLNSAELKMPSWVHRERITNAVWDTLRNPWAAVQAVARKAVVHSAFPLSLMNAYSCQNVQQVSPWLAGTPFTYEGFMVSCFDKGLKHAEREMAGYVKEGRLHIREDVLQGSIEDAPAAFIRMLSGKNRGKQLLELRDA